MACSFTAQLMAVKGGVQLALQCLLPQQHVTILLATDGRSALETLALGPLAQKTSLGGEIWSLLLQLREVASVDFCFVFAHCGWMQGESVDKAAKAALKRTDHASVPVLAQDEARVLSKPYLDKLVKELRADMGFRKTLLGVAAEDDKERQVNSSLSLPKLSGLGRSDARLVAQLRTGCCGNLGGWRHESPEDCVLCKEKGVLARQGKAVEHLFSCTQLLQLRQSCGVEDCRALVRMPAAAGRYARKALAMMRE